ncbi:MAG: FHA domain-containing protein [Fischerella sp.]|nr:FHA domain-containing protein [Fischerella sp.]
MITLTLLHPLQSIPAQSWTFADDKPVIRIGRAADNHVVLYSAVVSRLHVEIRRIDRGWEVVNLGANGTYVDGKAIARIPVTDGVILRLARSGPQIQIHLGVKTTTLVTSRHCSATIVNGTCVNVSSLQRSSVVVSGEKDTEVGEWEI